MAYALPDSHLAELFDVVVSPTSPQVHLHLITEEADLGARGAGRFELCCHGCGEALLVDLDVHLLGDPAVGRMRDDFERAHRTCPDHGYRDACHGRRSRVDRLDLRGA